MDIIKPLAFERKLGEWEAKGLHSPWRDLPRPWVFTNGCFDILHRGHVSYLAEAKSYGATLIVGVNSDASVQRLNKGIDAYDKRPINSLEDRMTVLAALESVDVVLKFEEDTPLELIQALRPDVLIKGGDWAIENMIGAAEVQSWDGKVYSIPFRFQRSTTSIVRKLRSLNS